MAKKKSTPAAPGNKITKIEGVRRALAELGPDATPTVIQGFVKERFGIEMSKDHASVSKGQIYRQAAKKAAKAKPAAAKPPVTKAEPKPPMQLTAATASPTEGGIKLEDIAATKVLLERVGVEKLRKLIDLLAV